MMMGSIDGNDEGVEREFCLLVGLLKANIRRVFLF